MDTLYKLHATIIQKMLEEEIEDKGQIIRRESEKKKHVGSFVYSIAYSCYRKRNKIRKGKIIHPVCRF